MRSPTKREDLEAKYDVVLNFPNLELHSAAASGNVGLVHYALTHGQPVNSVLHGVLPLHAACSGGSLSVVRMLIEQGADVNAPRLPRRYSDGKRGSAPSVGTAGSTPLHFAAANGHAPVVQMLLACGADLSKPDKHGHTPEDLARLNDSAEVVKVLQAYKKLRLDDMEESSSAGLASPWSSQAHLPEDYIAPSRKGKERAFSLSSNKSEQSLKVKRSLENFIHRRPKGSVSSTQSDQPSQTFNRAPPPPHLRLSPGTSAMDKLASPFEIDSPTSPSPQKGDTSPFHIDGKSSTNGDSPKDLSRPNSRSSMQSQSSSIVLASPPLLRPPPTRVHHPSTTTSRRPSLPSIVERAVHPGLAFRAAIKGSQSESQQQPPKARHKHGSLRNLFSRRTHSRSPSPPPNNGRNLVAVEELDHKLDRLKRASLDMERDDAGLAEETGETLNPTKAKIFDDDSSSGVVTSGEDAPPLTNGPSLPPTTLQPPRLPPRRDTPTTSVTSTPSVERSYNRPRTGSEVIQPSPLANEWAESDSEVHHTRSQDMKQSKVDVSRQNSTGSLKASTPESPASPGKPRALTMPSMNSVGKSKEGDLRKVAAEGMIRKESEKRHSQGLLERRESNEDEEEADDDWHDAVTTPGEELPYPPVGMIGREEGETASRSSMESTASRPSSSNSRASIKNGRIRSGSIGSVQTDTSRSPPPSTFRMSTIIDDHPAPRPRGKSVSSVSSGASGVHSSGYREGSIMSTNSTLPSSLSATQPSGSRKFPPVPEHEVMHHPGNRRRLTSRTISSHAEAQEAIKQTEDDILQLAQLPPSQDSIRDLAAQLAAYGERHEIEQAFVEREKAKEGGDGGSFYTADTRGSGSSGSKYSLPDRASMGRNSSSLTPMFSGSSLPSTNPRLSRIYDKRAAAYRERLATLTSTSLAPPGHLSSSTSQHRPRHRASSAANDTWLDVGPKSKARTASGTFPRGRDQGWKGGYRDSSAPNSQQGSEDDAEEDGEDDGKEIEGNPHISNPMRVMSDAQPGQRQRRHSNASSTASHKAHRYTLSKSSMSSIRPSSRNSNGTGTPAGIGLGPLAPSPYASIFSHKFSRYPLNDDESEDEEQENANYTMIENDWRGGRVMSPSEVKTGMEKNKWGLKKLGRARQH